MKRSFISQIIKCFILVLVIVQAAFAQSKSYNASINFQPGFPIINNYLPKDYKAHNQNWAIVKDKRGVMYFGNSSGVLEFDGQNWNLIKITNSIVRSMAVDDKGTIFIGSADDMGYLDRDVKNGTKYYKSLLSHIPTKESFGHVWYTFYVNKSIFFVTGKYIFQFKFNHDSYDKPSVKYWKTKERYRIAHCVNNRLFVLEFNEGLLEFDGSAFNKVDGSEIFSDNTIYSMLPYDSEGKKTLIVSKKEGCFIYNGKEFIPFKTEADRFIIERKIYLPGAKLPDGSFVINTSQGGIVIIDESGKIIRKIDMTTGILDDGVLYTFYSDGKLWLALQNGISVVDLPSSISYFNQNSGLKGAVSDVKIFNNYLFAATTAGIFRLDLINKTALSNTFEKFRNVEQEGWQFIRFKDKLLTALTDGVCEINGLSLNKIQASFRGCYCIYNSKVLKNRIYVGLETGLAVLDFIDERWVDKGKINGIDVAVRSIAEDEGGNLWLGTPYNGVYKLSNLSVDLVNPPTIKHFLVNNITSEEEVKIFYTNSGLLFTTKNKVLDFDETTQSFTGERNFKLNNYLGTAEVLYVLQDEEENIWLSSVKNDKDLIISFGKKNSNKSYDWKDLSFLKTVIDFSNSNAVFTIFKDESTGIVWFCGADGIVSYSTHSSKNDLQDSSSFSCMIRKVTINGDSLIFVGDDLTKAELGIREEFKLDSDVNLIRFDFSSLTYEKGLVLYQFKLDGFDDEWSDWTPEHRKDYTNLSPGLYRFRVQAKNIYNLVGAESTLEFSILSPWYLSWWSFLLYIILLIAAIFFVINYRIKFLEQKNIKLEEIVADRTKKIKEQAEKLKEMDELKSRFFANISHEFRTPLTLILGQIESVQNFVSDLKLKNKLQMGYRNAKRLERLINELLEISKIEAGKDKLKISKLNISRYLKNIFYSFESIAEKKNIELSFETEKEYIEVFVDWEKIEKVFNNLINNALKFTPVDGKISLVISLKNQNQTNGNPASSFVSIRIEDSGIGISDDKLPFIFDRFYQVDRRKISDAEGTGIGLALAKELVELHSGVIEVVSKDNSGTTFTVLLPLGNLHLKDYENGKDVETEIALPDDIKISTNEDELSDKYILPEEPDQNYEEVVLIIDDNQDIREFISEHLENDFSVFQASNGKSGVEKAKKIIPDLIITDVMMPLMDGFELSQILKNDQLTSHVPIIILTAKAALEDKMMGLETGVDDYLIKPFSSKELLIRVKNLIQNRKLLRQKFASPISKPELVTHLSIDQKFMQRVIESVNSNISNPEYSVEQLADDVAFSVSQLNRKLKALIDQPAGLYIRTIRLEKAAEMLKNKVASVKEIAFAVGFTEQSNFAKSFKKYFGISPSEFNIEPDQAHKQI